MMNLNIDQLDSEERKKISVLLKERQDVNKDKGVEYIFRHSDEREEFLLGKKLDLNKIVKDDKALMGESEAEFQERMEKRKLMQKMREDPMAIIQLNEQQAQKVALEKQIVHQKLAKKYQSKFQRNEISSSSDSDSSDCMDKLRELLSKHIDDDDNPIGNILSTVDSVDSIKVKSKLKKRHRSKTPTIDQKKQNSKIPKPRRSRSRDNKRKTETLSRNREKYSKYESNSRKERRHRSRSKSFDRKYISKNDSNSRYSNKSRENLSHREKEIRRPIYKNEIRDERLRNDFDSRNKHNRSNFPVKSKLTKEEREKRLQEMRDNAQEFNKTIESLDSKFQSEDKKQTEELEKNLKHADEYMLKEIIKLNYRNEFSLQKSLREKHKQRRVDKLFKS